MSLFVDTTPLRVSRDFRRLWIGQGVSFLGTTITMAALLYQVYHQTNSTLATGLLGLVQLGPLLVFSIVGGAFADRVDKRVLLLGVTLASFVCSGLLALNSTFDHPQLWLMYLVGAVSAGMFAVSSTVLRSLLPMIVEDQLRPAAFALQATYGTFGMMVGPAVGGILISVAGVGAAYAVDVGTYCVAIVMFAAIASSPPPVEAVRGEAASSILTGLRFLRGHSIVMSVFGIDFLAMVFGMPRALFPALADRLGGGSILYGLLYASVAAGAFVASLLSGWTSHVRRQGRAVLICVAVWGLAIAAAGVVRSAGFVLAMFAIAGGADMISGVFRSAIGASVTPDELRGRISGVERAVYAGGPVIGDIEAGVVGGLAGVPFAIVSGGLACIAAAGAFAVKVPSFANYTTTGAEKL